MHDIQKQKLLHQIGSDGLNLICPKIWHNSSSNAKDWLHWIEKYQIDFTKTTGKTNYKQGVSICFQLINLWFIYLCGLMNNVGSELSEHTFFIFGELHIFPSGIRVLEVIKVKRKKKENWQKNPEVTRVASTNRFWTLFPVHQGRWVNLLGSWSSGTGQPGHGSEKQTNTHFIPLD